jgi:hypothetical protein
MHIEKNVCYNILKLMLGMNDTRVVREDSKEMKIREDLWLKDVTPAPTKKDHTRVRAFQPSAPWVLDEGEKKKFISRVKSLRLPSQFATNPQSYFGGKNDSELQHLKSHDFHVMMQHVIPVALRGLLQPGPRRAIYQLCRVFQSINSPVLNPKDFPTLMNDVSETLCLLIKELPPTTFTISLHLVYHLAKEVTLCGVIHSRWMYPVERYFKVLKSFVKNLAKPEGSISESYWLAKNIAFLSEQVPTLQLTTYCKKLEASVENDAMIFQMRGKKEITLSNDVRRQINQYLFDNTEAVTSMHL